MVSLYPSVLTKAIVNLFRLGTFPDFMPIKASITSDISISRLLSLHLLNFQKS